MASLGFAEFGLSRTLWGCAESNRVAILHLAPSQASPPYAAVKMLVDMIAHGCLVLLNFGLKNDASFLRCDRLCCHRMVAGLIRSGKR